MSDGAELDQHDYLSTSCYHGLHDYCRATVNSDGEPKEPGRCKFCPALCICACHDIDVKPPA